MGRRMLCLCCCQSWCIGSSYRWVQTHRSLNSMTNPGNENHWFMAQARAYPLNSKALQGVFMKLFRAFKRPKYFLWSCTSRFRNMPGPIKCFVLSRKRWWPREQKTARLMILRVWFYCIMCTQAWHLREHHVLGLQLYLMLMERQEKFQDCRSLLEVSSAKLCKVDSSRSRLCLDYLVRLQDWTRVEKLSRDWLLGSSESLLDNWKLFQTFLDSLWVPIYGANGWVRTFLWQRGHGKGSKAHSRTTEESSKGYLSRNLPLVPAKRKLYFSILVKTESEFTIPELTKIKISSTHNLPRPSLGRFHSLLRQTFWKLNLWTSTMWLWILKRLGWTRTTVRW